LERTPQAVIPSVGLSVVYALIICLIASLSSIPRTSSTFFCAPDISSSFGVSDWPTLIVSSSRTRSQNQSKIKGRDMLDLLTDVADDAIDQVASKDFKRAFLIAPGDPTVERL
jgi:hypothetical protein